MGDNMKGKIIVIEGACDGIGKTTQYQMLIDNLKNDKIAYHHFPTYGSYQAISVEKYLNGEFGKVEDLSPYFVHSLYAHDRIITWESKLKKLYNEGNILLLDRYTTSSLIYQCALIDDLEEKKKFIDYVIDFEYKKLNLKEPDVVIFLTANFDMVTNLRNKRTENEGISNDIHEKNLDFMRKVYENANFVAEYLNWNIVKCDNDFKMRSKEDIAHEIYSIINN